MPLTKAYIPYGIYWSTPFCKWQGSFSGVHSVELAAHVATDVLKRKGVAPETFDGVFLGMTVPQRGSFYGAPWLAAMLGAGGVTGPTFAQACATSARVLASAALEVEAGQRECLLGVTCDRTSNGPHLYYPNPAGPGGRGDAEDWVWDNFNCDPWAKLAMVQTAENVAREAGFTKAQQDEVTLLRHAQYRDALAGGRAFQKKYMTPVLLPRAKKDAAPIEADEGIFPTTAEGLARLKPALEGGTVSFGTQTFPADGNAGIVVATRERAAKLAGAGAPTVQLLAYGEARVAKGMMPMAVVPAARRALEKAEVRLDDVKAVKTHNPFAVNDLYFARETGVALDAMNRYGSPLVFGHPQGPTGTRLVIELIEELALRGGGHGLFTGCAAGDTAMALVVKVG